MVPRGIAGSGPSSPRVCKGFLEATNSRVRVLFDTNVPAPLSAALSRHDVVRTGELGWQNLENGALLDAAETAGFEVLLTCEQNVPSQQNFAGRKFALVVLSTNHWPTIRDVASRIATRVDFAQRGQIIRIDVSSP